jgi:pyruvate kinase
VMLSAETASGKYPREAVAMMSKIVVEAESHMQELSPRRREPHHLSISETICESVAHAAQDLDMRAIAVFTETGTTARLISKYRPKSAIFGFATRHAVCARMNLMWGVHPVRTDATLNAEDMLIRAERLMIKRQAVRPGDVVAIVAGTRSTTGSTNFMRLHVVGGKEEAQKITARPDRRK